MSFQDLNIKLAYETGEKMEDLLDSFYIPVLEQSEKYYRIAGFFSSSALAVAATGIEGLIHNGGTMYLLVSPELSADDYRIIKEHGDIQEDMDMFSEFHIEDNPDDHLKALAYLLDAGRLKIKIVVPKRGHMSLFHQKVGVFFDNNNNVISFSGSINETAQAWLYNIEEFKVFCSWKPGQSEYLNQDLKKFLDFWKGKRTSIADVYDIPEAIRCRIISAKPRDLQDLRIMERYTGRRRANQSSLSLFPHQADAVKKWVENNHSLLMEMATGTGKTRTAIGCMLEKLKDNERLLVIVATPQNTLSRQWRDDFSKLGISLGNNIIVDGTNPKWKSNFEFVLLDLNTGLYSTAIVFTTHQTASNNRFLEIVHRAKQNTKILFICDEVHAIATNKQKVALNPSYEYRIGLSATPNRMFDDYGSALIRDYFGNKSFEFTIKDALNTINPCTGKPFLNQYEYHPIFVDLSGDEYTDYKKKTKLIAIEKSKEERDEERIEELLRERAAILKNAGNKFAALDRLINELGYRTIFDTLLFVSDKQMDGCMTSLAKQGITRAKITEEESASKVVTIRGETERQKIIADFKNHQLQMLLAIKCLDEGIDIPNARVAILMSNGTNPREYIQRIGRVIRQAEGKPRSLIYDFIMVSPNKSDTNILSHEARRSAQIADNAVNRMEVRQLFLKEGVDLNAYQ